MPEQQGTQVTFLDQTGAKSVKAKISPTVPVKKMIPSIITKMMLPTTSPDGTPLSYSLDHKEGGKRLQENQTLPEAQVKDGDHLIVYPEIVAGKNWDGISNDCTRCGRFVRDGQGVQKGSVDLERVCATCWDAINKSGEQWGPVAKTS